MLKIVSINIEGSKHLKLVIPFLESEKPDVVCMQEVIESDMPFIEEALGMHGVFAPQAYHLIFDDTRLVGTALFSKYPLTNIKKEYYVGNEGRLLHIDREHVTSADFHKMINRMVVSAEIIHNTETYCVANTHFTWTPDGESTECQLQDLEPLFKILKSLGDFILTGDFNAPRGKKTFSLIAEQFTDNIPHEYMTSLDPALHRVHGLQYMVDGLFTTPAYKAHNVRLQDGVSDHMAIVAEIEKSEKNN